MLINSEHSYIYKFVQLQRRGDFRPENPVARLPGQVAEKRKGSRMCSYHSIEISPKRPRVSPGTKTNNENLKALWMHTHESVCRPQTAMLVASFWLDTVKQWSLKNPTRGWGGRGKLTTAQPILTSLGWYELRDPNLGPLRNYDAEDDAY